MSSELAIRRGRPRRMPCVELPIRMTPDQMDLLQVGAMLAGVSVSEFVCQSFAPIFERLTVERLALARQRFKEGQAEIAADLLHHYVRVLEEMVRAAYPQGDEDDEDDEDDEECSHPSELT
jgi:hypothetical protein